MKILNLEELGSSRMWRCLVLCVALMVTTQAFGQAPSSVGTPAWVDKLDGVTILANGSGIMVAGNLWDSYMPANRGPYYGEAANPLVEDMVRMGNFDRNWSTPTHMWPGGYDHGNFWNKDLEMAVFDPDPNFNPATIGGKANPSYFSSGGGTHYAHVSYANKAANKVLGAGDPARDYYKETYWVDATKRHHAVYEAGWPTTVGVDIKMKVHQYTLHWNGFNDFIMITLTLTNTGNVDMNADGVAEITGHRIAALAMETHGENMCSYQLNNAAGRINRFGAQRAQAYIGDADPKGNPWDITVGFPGESVPGQHDMGLNDFPNRFYTEIWSGWSWLGVKKGDGTAPNATAVDKPTIFGSHPIGAGAQRGWYTASGQGRGISFGVGSKNPQNTFVVSTGEWYVDGGKARNSAALNLAPNPNYFSGGTAGDVTTFVPKAAPTRPNGDRKLYSEEAGAAAFEVNTYEPGWTKGYSSPSNFDGDYFSGVGPFSLEVGESMTVTWACVGGYRLAGIQNAMAAARYVYDNGDAVADNYPATPNMKVDFVAPGSPIIRWDNVAAADPNFGGYKIYRASQAVPINWQVSGMRVVDNYWKIMTPGPTPENLKNPMNASFTAIDFITNKVGSADSWGPYDLVKVIDKASAASYADGSVAPYTFSWVDAQAPMGLKFWYYVAAYTAGAPVTLNATWSGLASATTDFIETSSVNRNGASGFWAGTFPFAYLNSGYPTTAQGLKDIGTFISVDHYPTTTAALAAGSIKVSVKPNPYKKRALFDNVIDPSDHKVIFYNLPKEGAKVTILDVSGQIVQILNFVSSGASNGTMYWNLFSKTGIEVASGLYIYVVEYAGGKQVGYLSIMR